MWTNLRPDTCGLYGLIAVIPITAVFSHCCTRLSPVLLPGLEHDPTSLSSHPPTDVRSAWILYVRMRLHRVLVLPSDLQCDREDIVPVRHPRRVRAQPLPLLAARVPEVLQREHHLPRAPLPVVHPDACPQRSHRDLPNRPPFPSAIITRVLGVRPDTHSRIPVLELAKKGPHRVVHEVRVPPHVRRDAHRRTHGEDGAARVARGAEVGRERDERAGGGRGEAEAAAREDEVVRGGGGEGAREDVVEAGEDGLVREGEGYEGQ